MQEKDIIVIFGGSFNPPINSHLMLAEQIINSNLNISKLIFVPVSTKYNKNGLEENIHRYNMLNLMCKYNNKLEVSDIEMKYERQLYTIETLDLFQKQYKNSLIYFALGSDNLKKFKSWKDPQIILQKYKLIVLGRNIDSIEKIIEKDELLNKYKKSLIIIKNKRTSLSSSFIRKQIYKKEKIEEFVPKEVAEYIKKNNLYNN